MEGVDYHFVDDATFSSMVEGDEFLEWAEVFTNRYGTPRAWVEEQLARGRLVILEIDIRGAEQVKKKMPDALGIFVLPPSEEELLRRLRSRKREDEATIQRRFAEAKREIAQAQADGVYDVFIVNEHLEEAIEEAVGAVRAARE